MFADPRRAAIERELAFVVRDEQLAALLAEQLVASGSSRELIERARERRIGRLEEMLTEAPEELRPAVADALAAAILARAAA